MDAAEKLVGKFVTYIIDPIMLLIFALGFFFFLYGLVEFMWNLSKGGDTKEGKQHMLYGIIGMFIMMSTLGIIGLINRTFDLQINNPNGVRIDTLTPPGFFGN